MVTTVWTVLRALVGSEAGRWCRGCGEPIPSRDRFGMSESVCAPCRGGHAA